MLPHVNPAVLVDAGVVDERVLRVAAVVHHANRRSTQVSIDVIVLLVPFAMPEIVFRTAVHQKIVVIVVVATAIIVINRPG